MMDYEIVSEQSSADALPLRLRANELALGLWHVVLTNYCLVLR